MNWRKILGAMVVAFLMLLLLICGGGYLFLKGSAFNQFARRKIAEKTQQAIGAATTIGGLDFSIWNLTAHLYNITLRGAEGPDQLPLLTVKEVTVGMELRALLHRKVNLSQLIVEQPIAHIQIDHNGKNNSPLAPPSTSHTNVFELAVRHALLKEGEVTYKDEVIPLDADLYNLAAEIRFDRLAARYSGAISYQNGRLRYGERQPLAHSFEAHFAATPDDLTIDSAVLKIGRSIASLQARLNNYSDPLVEGSYNLHIDAHDFTSLVPEYKPYGDVALVGQIQYHKSLNERLLNSVAVDGQILSDSLSGVTSGRRMSIGRLGGTFHLANGVLQAKKIQFDAFGGRVIAGLNIENLDATPSGRLQASLSAISVRELQRNLREDVRQVVFAGTLNGTGDATWTGSIDKIRIRSDLEISAEARNAAGEIADSPAAQTPVNGMIHVAYDGARNVVTLRRSTLSISSTALTADGQISRASNMRVQVNVTDLRQLEMLASAYDPKIANLPPASGSAILNASMAGSLARPRIAGQLSVQNLSVQGGQWRAVQATVQASSTEIAITNGTLISAQRGNASFSGNVALRNWHYTADNPFAVSMSVQQMSITDLQHMATLNYPFSGDLSANISVRGTQANPQGSGTIQIVNARAYDEPVQMLTAQFRAENGSIGSSLHAAISAGTADANLSYTTNTKAYTVHLTAPSLILQKLHILQAKNMAVTGTVKLAADGKGTIENPQLNALLQVPQLTIRGKSISEIKASLQVANRQADLALSSKVVDSSVQARARINLTGGYYADASINTTTVPLEPLLATYLRTLPEGLTGQTELHATLKGPLKNSSQLEAHVTISTLHASYQSLQIGIASPIHADFANSVLTVQPSEVRGTDTVLRVQGSIPFAGNQPPSFSAEGSVDVGIAKIFSPDTTSSGTVTFDVHASGTAKNPDVNGRILFRNVSAHYSGAPLGVSKMNGTLDIAKNSIQISNLTGEVGGGDISAGGSIIYRPALQFNVLLQGKSVRLLYPAGLRTTLDSNLNFSGDMRASAVSGRVLIDSLGFTPDFDLSTFADQFTGGTSVPTQPGFADNVKLNVSVQSKENLAANSSQITVEGGINVRAIGTAANPVVVGRADLTSGEVFYRNVRYQLQRGIITFDNPNETSPVLNVTATTTIEQYNLTLTLRGPFDKLTTSYSSDPPLATADIINLLAQGQTTAESAAAGQSTDSILASQAAGQFVGGIQKLAGISSLQIDPLIGGSNQNPSALIAVQQRVTKNLLFTFSTDVSQPGNELVQGDYQINKRWSVRVTRDQVGGISVGGELHTKF